VIVEWTNAALADVERLYLFLAGIDLDAAKVMATRLNGAPDKLLDYPRLGERLEGFAPREVRRIVVGKYELRYEISGSTISVVRVFHGREDRNLE
jgi:plasmid stabilization system protein ParE